MADGTINIKFVPQGADDVIKQLEKLEQKAKALQQALQQATQQSGGNSQATQQLTQMQAAITSLKSSLDALRSSVNTSNQGLNQLGQQASALQQGMSTATTAIDSATQAIKGLGQGAAKTTTAVSQTANATANASKSINEMLTKYFTWDAIISGLQTVISKLQEVGAKALEVSSAVRKANREAYSQLGEAGGNELARQRAAMGREYGISESDMARYSQTLLSAGMTDTGDVLRTLRASILNSRRRGTTIDESLDKQKALYADAMDLGTVIEDLGVTDKELLSLGIRENADIEKSGARDRLRRAIYAKEVANAGYLDSQSAEESFSRIKAEFENLLKEVGDLVLPFMQELSGYLQETISELKDSPQVIEALQAAFKAITQMIEYILPMLPDMIKLIASDVQVFAGALSSAMDLVKAAAATLASAFYNVSSRVQSFAGNEEGSRLAQMQSDRYGNMASANMARFNKDFRKTLNGGANALGLSLDVIANAITGALNEGLKSGKIGSSISATERGATKARYSVGDAQADKKAADEAAKTAAAAQQKAAQDQLKAALEQKRAAEKAAREAAKKQTEAAKRQAEAAKKQAEAAEKQRKAAELQQKLADKYNKVLSDQKSKGAEQTIDKILKDRQSGKAYGLTEQSKLEEARQTVLSAELESVRAKYAPDLKAATRPDVKATIERVQSSEEKAVRDKYKQQWEEQDKEFSKYRMSDEYKNSVIAMKQQEAEAKRLADAMARASAAAQQFASSSASAQTSAQANVSAPPVGPSYTNNTVNISGSPSASQTVSTSAIREAANQVISDYQRRNINNSI